MHEYTKKYGKQFMQDILDIVLIRKHLTEEEAYELLLKHKIITKRTKTIHLLGNRFTDFQSRIFIKNGSNKTLLFLLILPDDIKQLLEDVR